MLLHLQPPVHSGAGQLAHGSETKRAGGVVQSDLPLAGRCAVIRAGVAGSGRISDIAGGEDHWTPREPGVDLRDNLPLLQQLGFDRVREIAAPGSGGGGVRTHRSLA